MDIPFRSSPMAQGSPPNRAVILLDTSSSMGPGPDSDSRHWNLSLEIASHFAKAMGSHTRLAFLMFDTTVHNVIDFSQGNPALIEELRQMSDGKTFSSKNIRGRTALYDAVYQGWQLLDKPSRSDILFVISDGGDNASSMKPGALERALSNTGIRLFAVRMQTADLRIPKELQGFQELDEVAAKSGGEVFGPVAQRNSYIHFEFSSYTYSDKTTIEEALNRFYEGS